MKKNLFSGIMSGAAVAALAGVSFYAGFNSPVEVATPWESIGGCGAGGSGGGSGDGIKWIGQGVSGGYLETEVFTKYSVGQNFSGVTFTPHFSIKPTWSTKLGVSIPWMSHSGEVQYRSNQIPTDRTTGGMGDLSFDFSKTIGSGGAASLSASLSIPTGQYDIKRGTDAAEEILPASFQKGSGLYSLTLGWDYSRDTDQGIWLYGLSYTHPFAMHLISGENEFNDSYWKDLDHDGKRFEYRFKPYGENDLGAYTPPSVGGSIAYGYRGRPGIVQSFGVNFSIPLGVAWINSEKVGTYDPRPDPDHHSPFRCRCMTRLMRLTPAMNTTKAPCVSGTLPTGMTLANSGLLLSASRGVSSSLNYARGCVFLKAARSRSAFTCV